MRRIVTLAAAALLGLLPLAHSQNADPLAAFREGKGWTVESAADTPIVSAPADDTEPRFLATRAELGDLVLSVDVRLENGASAAVFLLGRYPLELRADDAQWHTLQARFRAPRFDEGRTKIQNALLIDAHLDGKPIARTQLFENADPRAADTGERSRAATVLVALRGGFSFRNFSLQPADFEHLTLPARSGEETNEASLIDLVAMGRDAFESVGCSACHSVMKNDTAVTSGPNLFGLIAREPRMREVVEGKGAQRFTVRADAAYLERSIRAPADQLAVAESGAKQGEPYPPLMPAFSTEVLSDLRLAAIGAYLMTLNEGWSQGPVMQLVPQTGLAKLDPMDDRFQLLVDDAVRIQRGPMPGVSGRAIHVGQPNGVHFSFDPRVLGFAKVWQGGFLDRSGELLDRGGRGFKLGHEAREVHLGSYDYLFVPLDERGSLMDFSFKEAKFGDTQAVRASLHSREDHLERWRAMNARFLGYTHDSTRKLDTPTFRYRIGENVLGVRADFAASGEVKFEVTGTLKSEQAFAFNPEVLRDARVSAGRLDGERWILPPGEVRATLSAKLGLAEETWRPSKSEFDYRRQVAQTVPATAELPPGYSIESYLPPKDNYGRDQLFEALGLALAPDDSVFVATRTAGIWRLHRGEWRLFAEGPFDSLGVLVEDPKKPSVIVGQKAELTRMTDTNGDGMADEFETLFDAHSYHGNYHTYMHGPVQADGAYFITLNLAHAYDESVYKAGGGHMGTSGGFMGWSIRIAPNGSFTPWANGLRSPASLGVAPDGRLWYADNQGEFVGTSKLFVLEQGRFYGHPASLVDLPRMTPDSPQIAWDNVAMSRARAVVLFPHNRVANSPGHPAWDTTKGKFGPFAGQMLIGDQTQSNLLRVAVQTVNGIEQGSVMPFMAGLESGAMRPLFLKDGSLLIGQTGRGWQAKGGRIASLQHIRWDGKTIAPAIKQMLATPSGFRLELTQPLHKRIDRKALESALSLESWTYRDAPDYGSDELDMRQEGIESIAIGKDRKSIDVKLATLAQPFVHPTQTARVYHAHLRAAELFDANAPEQMDAYYTLYAFPE